MKRVLTIIAVSALLSSTAFAAEMTGYISDDTCAVKSAKSAKASDWIIPAAFETCAKKCLKEGGAAVFLTEDNKILRLDASNTTKVMPYLGHHVKLTGTVRDGMLSVDKVASIKMDPKQGTKSTAEDHQHGTR